MKKRTPKRGPPSKLVCGYLPDDPAGNKPTANQQRTSAKRYERGAARARQRPTSSSRSGASATSTSCATAATTGGSSTATTTGSTAATATATATTGGSSRSVSVDLAVLGSRSRAEARENLLLVHPKALRSPSHSTGAVAVLVLHVHGGLDLVTGVLQDSRTPARRRLGEGWCGGGQHHGQQRCRQHYLPQVDSSSKSVSMTP